MARPSPTTWRAGRAPRPPRASSRGAAAIFHVALLAGVVAAAGPATPARAALVPGLEPDGRAVCSGRPGTRSVAGIVPDGSGGHLVVVRDTLYDLPPTEGLDAFLIHLDPALRHVPVGDGVFANASCGALVLGGNGDQEVTHVIPLEGGRLAVAGIDSGVEPPRIFVQAFDAGGWPLLGAAPLFVTPRDVTFSNPRLAGDGAGGFFVAWTERRAVPATLDALVVARIDGEGRSLLPSPLVVSGGGLVYPFRVEIVEDGGGGIYIGWNETARPGAAGIGNWVQRVRPDGTTAWGPGGISPVGGPPDARPLRLLRNGGEGVVAVFNGIGIRGQRLAASGARLWGDGGILLSDPLAASLDEPEASIGPDGAIVASWIDLATSGAARLLVRRLGPDGALPWPRPILALEIGSPLTPRSQAVLRDGSVVLAIEERRAPADKSDIFWQAVDRRGRPRVPAAGLPAVTHPAQQDRPIVLAGGGGDGAPETAVLWADARLTSLEGDGDSFFVQTAALVSVPRLEATLSPTQRQDTGAAYVLGGDDLQAGAELSAGPGVTVGGVAVRADGGDGPGDSVAFTVSVEGAAPPGRRDLVLRNPDGGTAVLVDFLEVTLDPRRVDIDRSGRVDGYDLALLVRGFGRSAGDAGYDVAADIDVSGQIDGQDLARLAAVFGAPPPMAPAVAAAGAASAR